MKRITVDAGVVIDKMFKQIDTSDFYSVVFLRFGNDFILKEIDDRIPEFFSWAVKKMMNKKLFDFYPKGIERFKAALMNGESRYFAQGVSGFFAIGKLVPILCDNEIVAIECLFRPFHPFGKGISLVS